MYAFKVSIYANTEQSACTNCWLTTPNINQSTGL